MNSTCDKCTKTKGDVTDATITDVKFRLRQPFKVLVDIFGVITSFQFQSELFHYHDQHLEQYLLEHYNTELVQTLITELTTHNPTDRGQWPSLPPLDDCSDIAEVKVNAVVHNVRARRALKVHTVPLNINDIWLEGYRTRALRPPVFEDVVPNFRRWIADPYFIKIYSFATGSMENQKLFLSACTPTDLSQLVTSSFDACGEYKYDWTKFHSIRCLLNEHTASDLFYLTDSPTKGKQAARAGLTVFVVRRAANRKYRDEQLRLFRNITSLDQLDFVPFLNGPCC